MGQTKTDSENSMIDRAGAWLVEHGSISPVFLQRKLKISYAESVDIIRLVNEINQSIGIIV